jgi:hypothetical protein
MQIDIRAAGAALAVALALGLAAAPAAAKGSSVAAIKQRIIKASIAGYPGNCPCPYNSARNGSRCGGRSAWSRAGGYSPKCYPSDVTAAEVKAWQRR